MLVKRTACAAVVVGLLVACNNRGKDQRQETPSAAPSQAPVASPSTSATGPSPSATSPVAVSDGAVEAGAISTDKKTNVAKPARPTPPKTGGREATCRSACPGQPVEMTRCYCVCMGECPADEK